MASDTFEIMRGDRQFHAALSEAKLPVADIGKPSQTFWRLGPETAPIGFVGIEAYEADALLRSLVVTADHRGHGHGKVLVDIAIASGRAANVETLWLLTNTAADFFANLGWQRRGRADAPKAIASSEEFSSLCPSTAACFSLAIKS